jgi:alpha-D-ribose 1-methylphosphonate 5-triphosphate diphosphatase
MTHRRKWRSGSNTVCALPNSPQRWMPHGPHTLPVWRSGMGAPNVLRGKSSSGNLSAITAIESGAVDWLCADYYPASLLPVIFRLVDRGTLDLPAAVALISHNPARAARLDHLIGSIRPGLLADLIVVRRVPDPVVQHVFVGGRLVYTWTEQSGTLPFIHQQAAGESLPLR